MIKTVYNINNMIINSLSRLNSKLENKYKLIPLPYEDLVMNLNDRNK